MLVAYSNRGEAAGSHTFALTFGGDVVDEQTVRLDGNASGEISFTVTAEGRGSAVVAVEGQSTRVQVLAPALFEVVGVEATPDPANLTAGEPVSIVVRLANTGDVEGVHTLEVTVDDTIIETRQVTVGGRATVEQVFTFAPTRPGVHVIAVSGQTAEFDVYQLQRPDNGAVLVNTFGGGPNRLEIVNNRPEDLIVVLTDSNNPDQQLFTVYVHANSTATLRGIPSGTYATYYSGGADWCTFYRRFTSDADYGRFEEPSVFSADSTSYTIVTLTFGATDGS